MSKVSPFIRKAGSGKPRKEWIYDEVKFDSEPELLFYQWLQEAITAGYVSRFIYQPKPFVLSNGLKRPYWNRKKKVGIVAFQAVLPKIIYTADYLIVWTEKAVKNGLICDLWDRSWNECGNEVLNDEVSARVPNQLYFQVSKEGEEMYSVIDIKPPTRAGSSSSSYRDFSIKAPMIWDIYNILVQPLIPINPAKKEECFFSYFWGPKAYLQRPTVKGDRFYATSCIPKTFEEYEQGLEVERLPE